MTDRGSEMSVKLDEAQPLTFEMVERAFLTNQSKWEPPPHSRNPTHRECVDRLIAPVRIKGDCWEWTERFRTEGGYGVMWYGGTMVRATHLSLLFFKGERVPKGLCALHSCDNAPCIRPAHLSVGTLLENNQQRAQRGRSARGERHPHAKLTEAQVADIKARVVVADGRANAALAMWRS
jgi:hypothetical protein